MVNAFLVLFFVEIVKNNGKPDEFEKTQLVVQADVDKQHCMLTHARTFQQSSQRIIVCLYAIDIYIVFFTRDVSHVYVQADTVVERVIYVHSPVLNFTV